jgi:hypothetical protein
MEAFTSNLVTFRKNAGRRKYSILDFLNKGTVLNPKMGIFQQTASELNFI